MTVVRNVDSAIDQGELPFAHKIFVEPSVKFVDPFFFAHHHHRSDGDGRFITARDARREG